MIQSTISGSLRSPSALVRATKSTLAAILCISAGQETASALLHTGIDSSLSTGTTCSRRSRIGDGGVVSPRTRAFGSQVQMTSSSGDMEVAQIPCLSDNYGYLLHDPVSGQTAAIDTPSADAYEAELTKRGWKLTHILNTHHHWDHTGGNLELKKEGVTVYGPAGEKDRIPGIDFAVGAGDKVPFGNTEATVMDVGGHTLGHIAYHFPSLSKVFVGDSLFAMGCGRMFEGTPEQFWASLQRLRALPDETVVYCAHEYTQANARFAESVEPGNSALVARIQEVDAKRASGLPTVPTEIGLEKKTNPFLRGDMSPEIRTNVGATGNDADFEVFAKVRRAKDTFRG